LIRPPEGTIQTGLPSRWTARCSVRGFQGPRFQVVKRENYLSTKTLLADELLRSIQLRSIVGM
jgi:hypothetical protein